MAHVAGLVCGRFCTRRRCRTPRRASTTGTTPSQRSGLNRTTSRAAPATGANRAATVGRSAPCRPKLGVDLVGDRLNAAKSRIAGKPTSRRRSPSDGKSSAWARTASMSIRCVVASTRRRRSRRAAGEVQLHAVGQVTAVGEVEASSRSPATSARAAPRRWPARPNAVARWRNRRRTMPWPVAAMFSTTSTYSQPP